MNPQDQQPQQPNSTPPEQAQPLAPPQPTPISPSPAIQQAPVGQSQQSPLIETKAQQSSFSSNPFKSVGNGLGTLLSVNPQSGITINFAFLLVLIPLFLFIPFGLIGAQNVILALIFSLVFLVVFLLVLLRVFVGGFYLFVQSYRGQQSSVKEAIGKGASSKLTKLVIGGILATILIFAGLLLFIVPGLILLARLSLFPFIIYEENLGAVASLKRSFTMTKKHTAEMFGVLFTGSLLSGNSFIAPVVSIAGQANRYYELKEHEEKNVPTGKVHVLNYLIILAGVLLFALNIALAVVTISNTDGNRNNNSLNDSFYYETDSNNFNNDFNLDSRFNTLEN
jgi:hypothetical protein